MSSKPILIDDEEEEFLMELAAAEAEAALAKRRRVAVAEPKPLPSMEEGAYMTALKGSHSQLWQQSPLNTAKKSRSSGASAIAAANIRRSEGENGSTYGFPETSVQEKNCPCGLGVCLVFTSNTQKNPGRKFYRCPAREENGGCGFFEWCDSGQSYGTSCGANIHPKSSIDNFPDIQCPCGAGTCRIFTAKTGQNIGQQFYRCPENQDSCGFFKWCNDEAIKSHSPFGSSQSLNLNNRNKTDAARTGSSCFRCGKEGHWARDCAAQSNSSLSESGTGGKSSSLGACYKCGKDGHWARDCTAQSNSSLSESVTGGKSSSLGACYKCGKDGHWAKDCGSSQSENAHGKRQLH